jgi:hypothetical protein
VSRTDPCNRTRTQLPANLPPHQRRVDQPTIVEASGRLCLTILQTAVGARQSARCSERPLGRAARWDWPRWRFHNGCPGGQRLARRLLFRECSDTVGTRRRCMEDSLRDGGTRIGAWRRSRISRRVSGCFWPQAEFTPQSSATGLACLI